MAFSSLLSTFAYSKFTLDFNISKATEIEFITDFVKNDVLNSILLIAFICWTTEEKYALLSHMSQNNILTSVHNINDIEYVEHYAKSENILFLIDLDCDNSTNIMTTANAKNIFTAPYRWLLLTKNEEFIQNYEEHFMNYNFYVDNNIVLAHKLKNEYSLIDLYKYTNESEFMVKKNTTTWKFGNGFVGTRERYIPQLNRRDLNGTLIKSSVVVLNDDSLNHLTDYRFRHIDAVSKVNYIFTNILIDFVNGNRDFNFVKTWGYIDPETKLYTGMIGALQINQAEIGSTPLFITPDRLPIIEYVAMTTPTIVKFIFRQPPLSYVMNVFVLPFSWDVWLCSISLCVLVTIVIYIAVLVEWRADLGDSANALLPTLSEALMVVIGSVAQQGAVNAPRSGAGKSLMFITLVALMFLYVSYSANIIALLQSSATNIKTIEDLLQSRLDLGVDDTVYNRYYFGHATEPIRKSLYEQKVAPKGQKANWMTLEEGVPKIRQGLFAFHGELNAVYKLVQDSFLESEKCGLEEIQYIEVNYPYMAIKKNSTYKEILKLGLRKMHENGVQSREVHMLYSKKPECLSSGGNFVTVGLIDVYAAFLVLGCGMGLALFLFLVEVFMHRKMNKIGMKIC